MVKKKTICYSLLLCFMCLSSVEAPGSPETPEHSAPPVVTDPNTTVSPNLLTPINEALMAAEDFPLSCGGNDHANGGSPNGDNGAHVGGHDHFVITASDRGSRGSDPESNSTPGSGNEYSGNRTTPKKPFFRGETDPETPTGNKSRSALESLSATGEPTPATEIPEIPAEPDESHPTHVLYTHRPSAATWRFLLPLPQRDGDMVSTKADTVTTSQPAVLRRAFSESDLMKIQEKPMISVSVNDLGDESGSINIPIEVLKGFLDNIKNPDYSQPKFSGRIPVIVIEALARNMPSVLRSDFNLKLAASWDISETYGLSYRCHSSSGQQPQVRLVEFKDYHSFAALMNDLLSYLMNDLLSYKEEYLKKMPDPKAMPSHETNLSPIANISVQDTPKTKSSILPPTFKAPLKLDTSSLLSKRVTDKKNADNKNVNNNKSTIMDDKLWSFADVSTIENQENILPESAYKQNKLLEDDSSKLQNQTPVNT